MSIKTYVERAKADYDEVFEAGKKSVQVVDVGKFCQEVRFNNLNLFGTKEVVLNLDNATKLEFLHYSYNTATNVGGVENTTVEKLTVNCKKPILDMYKAFNGEVGTKDATLKTLTLNIDTSQNQSFNNCFVNMQALETISGNPLDFTSCTAMNQTFRGCNSLSEVRFVENTIMSSFDNRLATNFSKQTIESLVKGLSNEVSEKTLTLALKNVNKAFETSEGANDGSTSSEWLTLTGTKSNWTISLV